MSMDRRLLTIIGIALGVVLLLAVNIASHRLFSGTRLDLTENKLYTLSEGTLNILAKLDEPIQLRLFLSREQASRLPGLSGYTQRVAELVRQYEREAGGKIRLSLIDPEPFSEDEDRAVAYGLRGVSIDEGEGAFYFGLVGTSSTDDQEVIPFFSPNREKFLEHDVTKLIYQLSNPKQKVLGLMSSLPIDGGPAAMPGQPSRSWVIADQLRQLFEIRDVPIDTKEIPKDVDILMIVHPKALSQSSLYAIDQFILAGGRAVVYVDANAETESSRQGAIAGLAPSSSDLNKLFEQWGIELIKGKVVADIRFAERVRYNRDSRSMTTEYPVWINLPPDQFSQDDIVTSKLGNLFFATPGAIKKREKDGSNIKMTPLVETSSDAMLVDVALLRFLQDPTILIKQYKTGGKKLVLAARLSGKVNSAFPDGPPQEEEPAEGKGVAEDGNKDNAEDKEQGAKSEHVHLKESKDAVNLIVVADVDMLNERYWAQTQNFLGTRIVIPSAANGNFVINAVESLVGSNDLISVRSRGEYQRPFTRVAVIQQDAELKFRQKEQELVNRLNDAEQKLLELEKNKQSDDAPVLSLQQRKEIEKFTNEKLRIRKELRQVRHQLHKDIERLESWTKFINIAFMPLVIGIGGLMLGFRRARRRRAPGADNEDAGIQAKKEKENNDI